MAKPWSCRLGMHQWKRQVNEAGEAYQHCERCGADDDPKSRITSLSG
jgi:hypothetical protein